MSQIARIGLAVALFFSGAYLPAIAQSQNGLHLFPVVKNGKFGYINEAGLIAIAPQFLWASRFSEGRASVFVCHKYGYIDESGKTVIPAKFDAADTFSENLAAAEVEGKFGYIDRSGRMVIPATYDE